MLYAIFEALMPKTLDVNEFIAGEAEKTIMNCSRFCSGDKVADTLMLIAERKYV